MDTPTFNEGKQNYFAIFQIVFAYLCCYHWAHNCLSFWADAL